MARNLSSISTDESFRLISLYYQNKLNAENIEDNELIKKNDHFLYADIMRKSGQKDKVINFLSQFHYGSDIFEVPHSIELIHTYIYFKDYEGAHNKIETIRAKHRYLDKLKIFLFSHLKICSSKIVPNDDTYSKIVDMSISSLKEEFDFSLFEFLYNFVIEFLVPIVPIVPTPLSLQNESQESGHFNNLQSDFVEFKKIDTEENSCNVAIESKYSQISSAEKKDFYAENSFNAMIPNESVEIFKPKKSLEPEHIKETTFLQNSETGDEANRFFWEFIEKLSFMTHPLYFEKLKIEEVEYLAAALNSEILYHRYILLKGFESENELLSYFKNKPSHYIFRNAVYFLERFHYPKLYFLTKKAGLLTEEMVIIKNAYKGRHKSVRDLGLMEKRKIISKKDDFIQYTGKTTLRKRVRKKMMIHKKNN